MGGALYEKDVCGLIKVTGSRVHVETCDLIVSNGDVPASVDAQNLGRPVVEGVQDPLGV